MADNSLIKNHREPLFHVVKRDDMPALKDWLVRIATIVIAFILVGFLSMTVTGESFGATYEIMFSGVLAEFLMDA